MDWTDKYESDLVTVGELWRWLQQDMLEYKKMAKSGNHCNHCIQYYKHELSYLL